MKTTVPFVIAATLAAANALVLVYDAVRSATAQPILYAVVIGVYGLMGIWAWQVGKHLVALHRDRPKAGAMCQGRKSLRLLTGWLVVSIACMALVMLASLGAILQRIGQGFAVFG